MRYVTLFSHRHVHCCCCQHFLPLFCTHENARTYVCELPFHTHVCAQTKLAWHTDTQNPKKNLESASGIWVIVAGKFGDASAPFGVCSLAGQIRRVGEKTKTVTVSKGNVELKNAFVICRCVFVFVDCEFHRCVGWLRQGFT